MHIKLPMYFIVHAAGVSSMPGAAWYFLLFKDLTETHERMYTLTELL